MVAKLLRSAVGLIKKPEYRLPDETYWQAQRRESFRWARKRDRLRP